MQGWLIFCFNIFLIFELVVAIPKLQPDNFQLKAASDDVYDCQDVGYTKLKCKNDGKCVVVNYGTKNESGLCVCARGYYGEVCQYSGRVMQKFTMPQPAWTVLGDSNYVYITFQHVCGVVAYELDSTGLIKGSDYRRSVNSTLQVGTDRCDHMFTAMSNDGHLILTDFDSHNVSRVKTNPLALDYSNVTTGYAPGGVAVDQYNFMWVTNYNPGSADVEVYDKSGNMVMLFTLTEEKQQDEVNNGGILVTPDDQMYVADWSVLLIYTVQRNQDHVPVNLTYVSRMSFVYSEWEAFMLTNFNYDKWSNVIMGHDPQLEILQTTNKNQMSRIIPPEDNVFWRGVWTDPVTGYVFMVGDSNNLYVIDYSDLVS